MAVTVVQHHYRAWGATRSTGTAPVYFASDCVYAAPAAMVMHARPGASQRVLACLAGVGAAGLLAAWAVSVPLHAQFYGAMIALRGALVGAAFAAALALVTRTFRPALIYLLLAAALGLAFCAGIGWPPVDALVPPTSRPVRDSVFTYLGVLQLVAFCCPIPFVFALLGSHGPDARGGAARDDRETGGRPEP